MDHDSKLQAPLAKFWILVCIGLATLLLAWPSFVNRGPFFIADTTGYLRSADAAFSSVLSYDSIWSDKRELYKAVGRPDDLAQVQVPSARAPAHPPLIGRSIYYGAFIYAPVLLLGEHVGVLIQAALSAIVVWLALIPIGLTRHRGQLPAYFGTVGLLSIATSLPFTASLLVPDYLTGLAILAMTLLLCFWENYDKWQRAILASVICLAAVSHSSNLPLLVALALAGLVVRSWAPISAKAALIGIGAVILGISGDVLFVSAVEQKTGMTPIRPPFLTARLIADGPGHQLLRARCATEQYEVCKYAARTPHDSDQFLWSRGKDGVFSVADFGSQGSLSEQDMRFAIDTIAEYPLLTMTSSGQAFFTQLTALNLRIWRGDEGGRPFYDLENLPNPVARRMSRTSSMNGRMPTALNQTVIIVIVLTSLPLAAWGLVHTWRSEDERIRAFGLALAFVIFAIVANAAIAGGLSKPDARYNLRVIWLLPFCTGILISLIIARKKDQQPHS